MTSFGSILRAVIVFSALGSVGCIQRGRESPKAIHGPNGHLFIQVRAGDYWVGEADHKINPRRKVRVEAFEIAEAETTNEQFAQFVDATKYVTDAERRGSGQVCLEGMMDWEWRVVPGASWRFPSGPDAGGIESKMNHPVTQISGADAEAYCRWAGVRLPTLDEWEIAARAGSTARYPWGSEFSIGAKPQANIWNGRSHLHNTREDGYVYTAPVKSFPPNAWGLYDVIGNVFEYCADLPRKEVNVDAVAGRGGSWWCSETTCNFYNLVDIGHMDRHGALSNQGFRVAR